MEHSRWLYGGYVFPVVVKPAILTFQVKFDLERQAQNWVTFDFEVKLDLVDELLRGQHWCRADGRTDAGNDNTQKPKWPRVKMTSLLKKLDINIHAI